MMKKSHILIVDDEPDLRELLRIELREKVLELSEAGSSTEALSILDSKKIDFILCDIRQRESSGFELYKKLKENNLTGAKLILMSGFTEENSASSSKNDTRGFMLRPSIISDIENLIHELTEY